MTKDEAELAALEVAMQMLVRGRYETIREAEKAIRNANRQFDKRALTLSRKITALREKLEIEKETIARQATFPEPDPEWTLEDQTHYWELAHGAVRQASK